MTKTALIIIDLQNDYFSEGKFPLVGIDEATQNAGRLLAAARIAGDLVVHIRHESAPGEDAPFFLAGTQGAEIHDQVKPLADEIVVTKQQINAFLGTNLEDVLKQNSISNVTVIGAMSHMCVDAAVRAASDLGFATTVVHDAVATLDMEFGGTTVPANAVHAAFMAALAFGYANVVSSQEYLTDESA